MTDVLERVNADGEKLLGYAGFYVLENILFQNGERPFKVIKDILVILACTHKYLYEGNEDIMLTKYEIRERLTRILPERMMFKLTEYVKIKKRSSESPFIFKIIDVLDLITRKVSTDYEVFEFFYLAIEYVFLRLMILCKNHGSFHSVFVEALCENEEIREFISNLRLLRHQ